MKRYRVELAPVALQHAYAIDEWWRRNRSAARDLFLDELRVALERLEVSPLSSACYDAGMEGLRRLLLPRTRYHVYFTVVEDDALVLVHAIWHSAKGKGPPLR